MGTLPQAGVPGFGPNRIPSLTGVYALGEDSIAVYAVSEPLLFDPSRWEKKGTAPDSPWVSREEGSRIVALRRTFDVQDPRLVSPTWHFVVYIPPSVDTGTGDAFVKAFVERTIFFFSAAKNREALSFPATVEFSLPAPGASR